MGLIISVFVGVLGFAVAGIFSLMAATKGVKCPQRSGIDIAVGISSIVAAVIMIVLTIFFL